MKRGQKILMWALACTMAAGAARAIEGTGKIVFINLDQAFNEYYKTKIADSQLKAQAAEFNEERKAMVTAHEALQKKFNDTREEAQNKALNEEVRAQKASLAEEQLVAIRDSEAKIKRFDELRSKQLEDQSRRMRRGLVGEIREVIKAYAIETGVAAVMDASGLSLNGIETALYVEPKVDITKAVIERLNKGAPAADAGKAAP